MVFCCIPGRVPTFGSGKNIYEDFKCIALDGLGSP